VLWWGDPFDGTVPMGDMPLMDKIPEGQGGRQAALRQAAIAAAVRHGLPQRRDPPKLPT
jgi:hypothetical protein